MRESLEVGVVVMGDGYGGYDRSVGIRCVVVRVVGVEEGLEVVAVRSEHEDEIWDGEASRDKPGR